MNKEEWIKELEKEGFKDIKVCPIMLEDFGKHTHEEHTVHVILSGELIITDEKGMRKYKKDDRVEFPAGTTHNAWSGTKKGSMIVGIKK